MLAQASPTALRTKEDCTPLSGCPSPSSSDRCAVIAPVLQAGDVRTSIGSGLLQLGIQSKASVGIYGINCKGAATDSRQGGLNKALLDHPCSAFMFVL